MFEKKCANCKEKFPIAGSKKGNFGLLGRLLGMLFMYLYFGGTSKYCPKCYEKLKEQWEEQQEAMKSMSPEEQAKIKCPLDIDTKYRTKRFGIAAGITVLILFILYCCC